MKNPGIGGLVLALMLSACAGTSERGNRSAQIAVEAEPAPRITATTQRPSEPDVAAAMVTATSPAPVSVPPASAAAPTPAAPIAPKPSPRKAPIPAAAVPAASKPAPAKPTAAAAKPAPSVPVGPPSPNLTGAVSGRLELLAGGQQSVEPGEVAEGLIYFLPQAGGPRPKPGRFTITTQSKGFTPNLLIVPVGSTVVFPNTDTILHSVYSRTPGSNFDLKTYGPGQSRQTVLNQPGLVIVNCNVHHNMRANIVVLATPYFARPSADGSFRLNGLPTGAGTLVFWHPRANALSQVVQIGATGSISKKLTATRPRIDAHMQGKP